MAQTGLRFSGPDHGLWTKDLSALPTVSEDSHHSWCRAEDSSEPSAAGMPPSHRAALLAFIGADKHVRLAVSKSLFFT